MDIATITSDPRWAKATPDQKKRILARASDAPQELKDTLSQTVRSAVGEATMQPGTLTRDIMTDPVTQAKALPPLASAAALSFGIPVTPAVVGARQVSNAALRSYGRPEEVPSNLSQIIEGGTSALGDVTAIPAFQKARFGKAIGAAEQASGIANVPKEAPPGSARTAVKLVQLVKQKLTDGTLSMEVARSLKPAIKTIFDKGWLRGTEYLPDAVEAQQGIQSILNQDPVRKEAATALARSQTVPHLIDRGIKAIPRSVKYGMGFGTGATGAGGLAYLLGKKLFGSSEGR